MVNDVQSADAIGDRDPGDLHPSNPEPGPAEAAGIVSERVSQRASLAHLIPSKTQWLVLVIGLLSVSNVALWLGLRDARNGPSITVVGVREMTQDYVRKISSPQLTEQESLLRAQMFVAAAQDELKRLVPGKRLVLAKECVLAGEKEDITADLQKAVEAKLAHDTVGLSNIVGPVQASGSGASVATSNSTGASVLAAAAGGRVTAGALLAAPSSPPAERLP